MPKALIKQLTQNNKTKDKKRGIGLTCIMKDLGKLFLQRIFG